MRGLPGRLLLIAGLFLHSAAPSLAQNRPGQSMSGQITGQVRYAEGRQPAFNVLVNCYSLDGGLIGQTNTDRDGRFRFSELKPDQYVIVVRLPDYVEEQQNVELRTTANQYLQFQLKRDESTTARARPPGVLNAKIPPAAQEEFAKAESALAGNTKESLAQGILHLERALKIYPTFVQAQLRLGTAYMDLAQWDKAERSLKRAIEIDARIANAFFALGDLYLHQKRNADAESALVQGLKIDDRSWQGHLTLGRVYWSLAAEVKDEARAKPLLEKSYNQANRALELKPDLAAAHLLKGNLLLRARRTRDALKEFDAYLSSEPHGELSEQTRALAERIRKSLASEPMP